MIEGERFVCYFNAIYYLCVIHYLNIIIYVVNLFNLFVTLIYLQTLIAEQCHYALSVGELMQP